MINKDSYYKNEEQITNSLYGLFEQVYEQHRECYEVNLQELKKHIKNYQSLEKYESSELTEYEYLEDFTKKFENKCKEISFHLKMCKESLNQEEVVFENRRERFDYE